VYRYHHLFADALRARLAAGHADRVGELHAAASRWLANHGLLADAVRHAIASGDHEHAADLVELTLADMRRRRQDRTLRDWLVALPDDVIRRRPLLAMFMGWSRLSEGDFDGVEAWLDAAESALETAPPLTVSTAGSLAEAARDREAEVRSLPAMIAVYRASVAQARGDVGGTVSHARRALALAGPGDHFPRGAAAGFIGLAAWAAGDLAAVYKFATAGPGHRYRTTDPEARKNRVAGPSAIGGAAAYRGKTAYWHWAYRRTGVIGNVTDRPLAVVVDELTRVRARRKLRAWLGAFYCACGRTLSCGAPGAPCRSRRWGCGSSRSRRSR